MSNPFGDFFGLLKAVATWFLWKFTRGEWLAGSFILTSHTWIQNWDDYLRLKVLPPTQPYPFCRSTSLAHRRCQLRICVVPTRASRRWGLWTMVKQSVENQNHQRALWMEHAWLEKKEPRKFRSLRIWVFAGFWAFCWCLLLPSWFIWLLCITTDEKCHASSKSCHTYVETSNQRPNHKRRIYQPAGRWGWIASIRVPWLQIVTEDWRLEFFSYVKLWNEYIDTYLYMCMRLYYCITNTQKRCILAHEIDEKLFHECLGVLTFPPFR